MRITYDKEADAVYIYVKYPIKNGESKTQVSLDDYPIILDFDKKSKLLGIEVLNASKTLNKNVLKEAITSAHQ
ncbi:DUF2283 domain-containing protein [Candidatus Woesearchaeota archaeon]|nr:DUF2283 domain-containing protein [Candidatus Woesearchaeota archaeon]